jgi:hypothetical protein
MREKMKEGGWGSCVERGTGGRGEREGRMEENEARGSEEARKLLKTLENNYQPIRPNPKN